MFFVNGGGIPHEFEGNRGHLWHGLPGIDEVVREVSNCIPSGILMRTAVTLPLERVGTYTVNGAAGTYDGEYLRVWSVHVRYAESDCSIGEWLKLYYDACVRLYMNIIHGRAVSE